MSAITTAQKQTIFGLMRRLELPCDYITSLHQAAFVAAGATPQAFGYLIGRSVDSLVDRLTVVQASKLIDALKAMQ